MSEVEFIRLAEVLRITGLRENRALICSGG